MHKPHGAHTTRRLLWALLCGGVFALLWLAPAQWLAQAVQNLSRQHVQLRQVRGTVWNGSAQWVLTSGSGGREALALPQRVHWQLRPLWNAGVSLDLQADCCTAQTLQLQLHPDWHGLTLELTRADSVWPVQWLSGLGAPWNSMDLQGQLLLNSRGLQARWSGGEWLLSGEASLELRELSSSLSTLKPLGTYVLQLQAGAVPVLTLQTREGRLQLEGRGSWQAGRFSFLGEARCKPGFESALNNLLGVLGQRAGDKTILRLG
jgi:general secretion pathway protein N